MIGLDTNVIIRYLTQDDKAQSNKANKLIENTLTEAQPGFISLICLVEVVWVLESCYEQSKQNILNVVQALLTSRQLLIENAEATYLALKRFSAGKGDFSDALIAVISEQRGCESIKTFDKKATSLGMTLL